MSQDIRRQSNKTLIDTRESARTGSDPVGKICPYQAGFHPGHISTTAVVDLRARPPAPELPLLVLHLPFSPR